MKTTTNTHEYEVSFTFYISLGENSEERRLSVIEKDNLLDSLDSMHEIVDYNISEDDEDWCIDCIANIAANVIDQVDKKMDELLSKTTPPWDYHYIKGLDTNEFWQP